MLFNKIRMVAFVAVGSGSGFCAAPSEADFFSAYCLKCHGDDPLELEGETDLRSLEGQTLLEWQTLIEQIDNEEMPTKAPFPSRAERDAMIALLHKQLAGLGLSAPAEAMPQARQLTRDEYSNTIRDLLGIDLRAGENLPTEGQGGSGFSNDRTSLAISPAQMELLFASAERALDGAFAIAETAGGSQKTDTFFAQDLAPSNGVKPSETGMLVVQPTHFLETTVTFPVDGYYEFSVTGASIGEATVAQFYAAGEIVGEVKVSDQSSNDPERVTVTAFVKRGVHAVKIGSKNLVPHIAEPPNFVGKINQLSLKNAPRLAPFQDETEEVKTLRESLNIKSTGVQESVEFLAAFGPKGDPRKIDLRRIYYEERKAGWDKIARELAEAAGISEASLLEMWNAQNKDQVAANAAVLKDVESVRWEDWMRYQGKLDVEKIEVSGPVLPQGELKPNDWNLIKRLGDPVDPVTLVREFAAQAFRRPVSDTEIEPYVRVVIEAQRREEDRARSVKLALAAILMSPDFLYRKEPAADVDLSYFLWLSKPDSALASADLSDAKVLNSEIDRLIADPRSEAFFERLSDEWLEIGELGNSILPDRSQWPEFSIELAESMRGEVHQFVATLFRENRPIADLLSADYTFVDRQLADFYGMQKGGKDERFSRVRLSNPNRFGLLGKGAVLVTTSSPARTNPVRRGKWVWENLLGLSVGEPLPDAGELPGDAGEARGKTLREELAAHSSKAECARCHDKIDPIGFGLQNFDATGRWRDLEAGRPVDSTGELAGGGTFSGPVELNQLLIEKRGDALAKNVAKRLRSLFRGIENEPGFSVQRVSAETGLLDLLKAVVSEEVSDSTLLSQ